MKKQEYNITLYKAIKDARFVLGNTTNAKNALIVIGLNPSIADDKKPDATIKRVMQFAADNKKDGFVMLNLYPQRTSNPDELAAEMDKQLHESNIEHIEIFLSENQPSSMLAAWGETIKKRKYLKKCLTDIFNKTKNMGITWLKIGETHTKSGHPRHPSRAKYQKLTPFDIGEYLKKI